MSKIHIAISTHDIAATVADYSKRLGAAPCIVLDDYALWRTETVNLSVRNDKKSPPGQLRHLGWENPDVNEFSNDTDVNGIVWEEFNAQNQADEINDFWPHAGYTVKEK